MKDTLFSKPLETLSPFQFDESVVSVFPDMIQRSVPGYDKILTGIGELAHRFVTPNSNVYDLGCSLGAASLAMRRQIQHHSCKIIAVDNSESMIQRAQETISAYHSDIPIELVCGDISDISIKNASMVVINFTLQFILPDQRQQLIDNICQGLNPGGILVVSEKVHFEAPAVQSAIDHMHLQFKRANGYSELEISQKRASLEDVLVSDTLATHHHRFRRAGFEASAIWQQTYNFASFIAIKG